MREAAKAGADAGSAQLFDSWIAVADQVTANAQGDEAAGYLLSAGTKYLRASGYYLAAERMQSRDYAPRWAAYDKGLAVDELMDQPPFVGRRPVVVGDDRTDEFAFAAANAHGGVSVLVGPRSDTVAQYRIADPAAVRGWLSETFEEVP